MGITPRRLRDYAGFRDTFEAEASALPWPEDSDSLLRKPVGDETWIYPLQRWVPDHHERLEYFVLQYHEMAREAVKTWLRSNDHKAENYIFVIAYLYRHAVELRLKAVLSQSAGFQPKDDAARRKALDGHSLLGLWQKVERDLPDELRPDAPLIARLISDLHRLDTRSDGFRYPFGFGHDGRPETLARDLADMSGENLVWVLEAMMNWLNGVPDAVERERQYQRDLRESADPETPP